MSMRPLNDFDDTQCSYLLRTIELAAEALEDGDEPFGSVLVDPSGLVLFEDRNRVKDGNHTRHPELEIARWAGENLDAEQRAACTVYTSGEHCPMCAAAHAWVGLGPIVYVAGTHELQQWHAEWGLAAGPVRPLSIDQVTTGLSVSGPVPELLPKVRALHAQLHGIDEP
ncbi:nucleoside deaminase [Glutamicibacter endophyticus]|uniref:nucleoside deaminase n=1 Tax=Glutamicibacter endophyticus TaxID=1522174 RepID=UPI003AF08321